MSADGAAWAAETNAEIKRNGQPVTLMRLHTAAQIPVSVDLHAVVRGYRLDELAGSIVQGDREVTISPIPIRMRHWPGPPRKNDRVLIGADVTTIQGVETVQVGDTVIRHNIHVRG
ncbi:MAG: hypothetical protein AB7F35_06405 [Acetobacteraceae bacterium]